MIPQFVPRPVPGGVETRLVYLLVGESDLARLRGYLDEEELRRGNRLVDGKRRDLFFAGRGILRELLGGLLGVEPNRVALVEGEAGKPRLAQPGEIDFNVSHAGDYLLAAFTAGCQVGVDLEWMRGDIPYQAIAERYFSKQERDALFGLPAEEQLAAFYRCWTRKEAYLKGTGTGFTRSLADFDVSLLPGEPAALLEHRGDRGEAARWQMADIEVPHGYCAAVAVELTSHGDTEKNLRD
ncbi:MAG TPA: 4'-phosphopantetheinyl transferase superfamily protein [Geomonas sp.]|nr:4'-phosphopantetheinyl transferase superfamily protein [Geomonas sp.]